MKDILTELARRAGRATGTFGACDVSSLIGEGGYQLFPEASEYFSFLIPSANIDLGFVSLLSARAIVVENRNAYPSCLCAPHGLITFATDACGDAFSLDVTNGKVFHLSHEKYEPDGIHPGWNASHTAFLPPVEVTRESIINTSERCWDNLAAFFSDCLSAAQ